MAITGDVIAVVSHWTADGSRIVTEATIATATGNVTVSQLGGTVGELTMRQFAEGADLPAPLAVGMHVTVDAHDAPDLRGVMHSVVDAVHGVEGFVRTGPTKGGHSLYWEASCIYVAVAAEGTKDIDGTTELDLASACIDEWNTQTESCSFLTTIEDAPVADHEVGHDEVNLIKFRDSSWCRPAVDDDPARCYAESAAGITTAVFVDSTTSARDGAIVDADIEINGVDFDISYDGMSLGHTGCLSDLKNTLTHELGHLHGLEHTCLAPADPPRVDQKGHDVPLCSATHDPVILDATMYNYQSCGETSKASLSDDDIAAICTIYPKTADHPACNRVGADDPGCCGTSPHPGAALLIAGGVIAFLTSRSTPRRKRR